MEIEAMERLIAAKMAESNKHYELLNATKEWIIVGEIEDDREVTVEAMEELNAAKIAEKESYQRQLQTLNTTKQWKLQHKPFS